jgi:hypothetical protein
MTRYTLLSSLVISGDGSRGIFGTEARIRLAPSLIRCHTDTSAYSSRSSPLTMFVYSRKILLTKQHIIAAIRKAYVLPVFTMTYDVLLPDD